MLSPDNNVSSTFAQSFNRYTYCNNNPLKYIDPSGESAVGANQSNQYTFEAAYSSSPFIGGSYIEEQKYLSNNGIGCFYYGNFFGATVWIYGGGNPEGYIHFSSGIETERLLKGGKKAKPIRETISSPEMDNATLNCNYRANIKYLGFSIGDNSIIAGGFCIKQERKMLKI